jgi:hypothetical protein
MPGRRARIGAVASTTGGCQIPESISAICRSTTDTTKRERGLIGVDVGNRSDLAGGLRLRSGRLGDRLRMGYRRGVNDAIEALSANLTIG